MTGDKSLLSDVVEGPGPMVTFGDNTKGVTEGHGQVYYQEMLSLFNLSLLLLVTLVLMIILMIVMETIFILEISLTP
jgi:hypothetical protein